MSYAVKYNRYQYRWWQEDDDAYAFAYTPHKQSDGKFHAVKLRAVVEIKDVAFAKRKVARARAYKWYCKRKETLEKMEQKAQEKKAMKKQLTPIDKKLKVLKGKISNANKRMIALKKTAQQSRSRIKRAKTQYEKWKKREERWSKELTELQKETEGKIKSFVETLT